MLHFKKTNSHILSVAVILLGVGSVSNAGEIASTWKNISGNWSNATNWSGPIPNDFTSPDSFNEVEADFTGSAASTVIVDSSVAVTNFNDTNPNTRFVVNTAGGAVLEADANQNFFKLAGTLAYNANVTTAPIDILNVGAATISGGGSNLTSTLGLINFSTSATAPLTINDTNIFTNDGGIEPGPGANGAIDIQVNSFVNHGTIVLDGGTINSTVPININDGNLNQGFGRGTINAAVSFTSASHFDISADEFGDSNFQLTGPIVINSTTPTTLNGMLDVGLAIPSDFSALNDLTVVTLLSNSNGITGTFSNAPNGSQIFFDDGEGDPLAQFKINYTPDAVTLTNFIQLPEPGAGVCLLTLSTISLIRRRRKA